MAEPTKEIPTDPALTPAAPAAEEGATSKKGAKKAEAKAKKEAEKARKAAEREAAAAASGNTGAGEDLAKENYGDITTATKSEVPNVHLREIGEEAVGKTIKVRAWIQNARMQGAKMAFVELREEGNWTIQGVVSASAEGKPVSKQMVKWIGGLKLESFVLVEAVVQKPLEAVKSTKVSGYELHLQKVYLIAAAPEMLGLGFGPASRAVGRLDDEDIGEATEAMHKRAPVSQAIADIRIAVEDYFCEYLRARRFKKFHPPSLIGAASEGGANVFKLPYFEKDCYLAQSPQFYKQFEIAGGRKRVYCFTGLDLEMEIDEHYHEVMHMIEGLLLHIFKGLSENYREEIELIRSIYPSEEFLLPEAGKEVRLTFAEGQKLLREEGPPEFAHVSDSEDMSTAQEKALGALVRKKYNTDFYILDKFPIDARPFYALPDPENPKVTNAYDFMMRGQEILSGGQRVHLPQQLEETIRAKGLDPNQPGLKEIYFLRKEQPSVNRAFPPVGWHNTVEHPMQTTTICACEKTVVMVKQPGHLTSMKKDRGSGTRFYLGFDLTDGSFVEFEIVVRRRERVNDILRKHGVIPEKPPSPTPLIEEAILEGRRLAHENRLEGKDLDELDALEDEEDAAFLEKYRQQRVSELASLTKKSLHGSVYPISKPDYAREVTEASDKELVLVNLTSSLGTNVESRVLTDLWRRAANEFGEVKFCEIRGDMAIEGYPDRNCPTILVYDKGEIVKLVVTLMTLGGVKIGMPEIDTLLIEIGAIQDNDMRVMKRRREIEDEEEEKREKGGIRSKKQTDDDDDWD
ncbi:hypothetical protein B7494_g3101 [Chlorociboria aeruginascens]|nr:hypothetical protein B7494_g3101 [Chlorociboria aeruginascens]